MEKVQFQMQHLLDAHQCSLSRQYTDDNVVCKTCKAGSKPNVVGDACTLCSKGTFGTDGKTCVLCSGKTFSDIGGSVKCKVCGDNSHSSKDGVKCDCDIGYRFKHNKCVIETPLDVAIQAMDEMDANFGDAQPFVIPDTFDDSDDDDSDTD